MAEKILGLLGEGLKRRNRIGWGEVGVGADGLGSGRGGLRKPDVLGSNPSSSTSQMYDLWQFI